MTRRTLPHTGPRYRHINPWQCETPVYRIPDCPGHDTDKQEPCEHRKKDNNFLSKVETKRNARAKPNTETAPTT